MKLFASIIVLALAFGVASAAPTVFDEGFASFITENAEYERKLSSEINDKATKNVAAAPYYGFLKERYCEAKFSKDSCTAEPPAKSKGPDKPEKRRLSGPPPMPSAFLLPDPHVGSAANFSFPCYPLDREDGDWIMTEPNDDMSFELILPFDFKLYGTVYPAGTSIFLNNNGNLSFDNAISSFTASEFPINSPMIAPFWSDVDTRAGGEVWYKFFPDNKLAVIWDRVGYYPENINRLNTFQVVISDGLDEDFGLGTNVCFCYVDMDWTTGGASNGMFGFGGDGATVGVNRGLSNDYIQVGMFNDTGSAYDGPGGSQDGVDFLDLKGSNVLADHNMLKKGICFEATGHNIPPISNDFPQDNTITVPCGSAVDFTVMFTSPEVNQDITLVASNAPAGMIINQELSVEGDAIKVQILWNPNHATQYGIFEITFFAEDDYEIPANHTEVLKINVARCGNTDPDIPINCANITTDCAEDIGPYCTPFRSPEHCPVDESFPLLITNRRVQAFQNPTMVEYEGFWFHHLEDKVAQHAFTATSGYPPAELYCCVSESVDLGDVCFASGHTIPTGFTIRATGGHSGKGIFVLPYGFGGVDLISGVPKTLADIELELGTSVDKILVEKFIDGSDFGSIPSLPTEYKVHIFNGTIGAIDVVHNKGTDCSCYAVVDEDWNRLDKYGCFVPQPAFGLDADQDQCYDIDFDHGSNHPYKFKGHDLCGEITMPMGCLFQNIKDIAVSLSKVLGVYMRIDLFVSGDGEIFVQEYSSNHAGGLRHCAAKKNDDTGCIDSCFLGKLWKDKSDGTMYGGPQTPLPPILDGWSANSDATQCSMAVGATSSVAYVPLCMA